jgi:hypothetical protein
MHGIFMTFIYKCEVLGQNMSFDDSYTDIVASLLFV